MTFSKDLTSCRFGMLLVLSKHSMNAAGSRWLCLCDCGRQTVVDRCNLKKVKSCGCYRSEATTKSKTTHGKTGTKVYRAWRHMLNRCGNPNDGKWKDYGGRGISVCERWQSFEHFYTDMGDPPDGTSLDRIDVNGNYEPSNCRWATPVVQARNKRGNHLLEFRGETKTMAEWSEQLGIASGVLQQRLGRHGWDIERALTTPVRSSNLQGRTE